MRRPTLFPPSGASHAGHALNRRTPVKQSGQEGALTDNLKAAANLPLPDVYAPAFSRWQAALASSVHLHATTTGPLAVGLGTPSPYEVGLTLHHTYGVPYLPGSALKGLALRAARRNGVPLDAITTIFGQQDLKADAQAGHVTFWDGWITPDQPAPLQLDTITVHHPEYYGQGRQWPTDFDDPTPVAFVSVRPNVRFELRLSGPPEWTAYAARLLDWGLTHLGLGGKTNAGYGSFAVQREKTPGELEAEARAAEAAERRRQEAEQVKAFKGRAHTLRQRIAGTNLGRAKAEVPALLSQAADLPPTLRRELLTSLLERLNSDARTRTEKKLLKTVQDALEAE